MYILLLSQVPVNGLPGQPVGLVVQRPVQVGNSTGVELFQGLPGLAEEGITVGGLDLTLNGETLKRLGDSGEVVTVTVTPQGTEVKPYKKPTLPME